MVTQGAGWLLQANWQGGIAVLRDGVQKAIELNVPVTYVQSIARYMQQLHIHRPSIATQLMKDFMMHNHPTMKHHLLGPTDAVSTFY